MHWSTFIILEVQRASTSQKVLHNIIVPWAYSMVYHRISRSNPPVVKQIFIFFDFPDDSLSISSHDHINKILLRFESFEYVSCELLVSRVKLNSLSSVLGYSSHFVPVCHSNDSKLCTLMFRYSQNFTSFLYLWPFWTVSLIHRSIRHISFKKQQLKRLSKKYYPLQ